MEQNFNGMLKTDYNKNHAKAADRYAMIQATNERLVSKRLKDQPLLFSGKICNLTSHVTSTFKFLNNLPLKYPMPICTWAAY